MQINSILRAFFGTAVLGAILVSAAHATVETDWPAGTPNMCQDPQDGFMDFELGIDQAEIESTIPGLDFTTTFGLNWRYADIRTGAYNVNPHGTQDYEINGDFFAWLGATGDTGRITFTGGTGNYLSTLVSTTSGVTMDAFDADGVLLANSGTAASNAGTGTLTRLTVEASGIAYVEVHDTGNYWLLDDVCTDAPPPCQPVPGRTLGDENDRINLVFVPNEDYNGDITAFLADVDDRIDNRLAAKPPIDTNLDKFNFYYTELEGSVTGYPGGNCGQLSSLPDDFLTKCPQADAVVVLHVDQFTDCNRFSGDVGVFSAEGGIDRSFIHEGGHGMFQLRDTYDSDRSSGSCAYTSYDTGRALPSNIWETEDDCQDDAAGQSWGADECYMYTPCQDDWWKLGDPDLATDDDKYDDDSYRYIMFDGTEFSKGWGAASERRINWVFDNIGATPEPPLPPPSGERAIILDLNLSDTALTLLDKKFVIGPTPKHLPGQYSLTARMYHASGNMQGEYGFEDPRNVHAEDGGSGGLDLENVDFTLKLPYFNHLDSTTVFDSTGTALLTVDLSGFASAVNDPPTCDANGPYVVECQGATSLATLDGSGSFDPDGDPLSYDWSGPFTGNSAAGISPTVEFSGLGGFSVDLSVEDGQGGASMCSAGVTVQDTTPPLITSITASPDALWPPNHKMVSVEIDVEVLEVCDPATACQIVSVTSNEAVNGKGDGNTTPDWEITGDLTLDLRAERSGKGSGRVYTATVECTDASMNSSSAAVTVTVAKSRKK